MSYFYDLKEIDRKQLAPGVTTKLIWGDKIMISLIEMEPYSVVPVHSHIHEQAGLCVQGEFDFTICGETKRIGVNQGWMIPGGVVGSDTAEGRLSSRSRRHHCRPVGRRR